MFVCMFVCMYRPMYVVYDVYIFGVINDNNRPLSYPKYEKILSFTYLLTNLRGIRCIYNFTIDAILFRHKIEIGK